MVDFHFILAASLFILGLNYAVEYSDGESFKNNSYKNVLWFLKYNSIKYIGEYWTRPLFGCVICMSSFWGTALYFLLSNHYNVIQWLVSIVVIAGTTRVLKNFL